MPTYIAPKSDPARLGFLQATIGAARGDHEHGLMYLSPDLLAQVEAMHARFSDARAQVNPAKTQREIAVREAEQAMARLKMYLRHLWTAVVHRAERLADPTLVGYYQLDQSGKRPRPTNRALWLALAEQVIQGEGHAVAAGYAPILEPSIAELQGCLAEARHWVGEISEWDARLDGAQAAVEGLRPAVDALIGEVVAVILFNTRHLAPSDQRRILRRYGAIYYERRTARARPPAPSR